MLLVEVVAVLSSAAGGGGSSLDGSCKRHHLHQLTIPKNSFFKTTIYSISAESCVHTGSSYMEEGNGCSH